MNDLLGIQISGVLERMRRIGIESDPIRDEPDLHEDPEWESTVWVYPDDGIAISFVATDGGQFDGDFVVEAILVAGKKVRSFPLYSGEEPILQPTSLPPYPDLGWELGEADVVKQLGDPSVRNSEGLRYNFPNGGYFVLFTFEDGTIASVRYQTMP